MGERVSIQNNNNSKTPKQKEIKYSITEACPLQPNKIGDYGIGTDEYLVTTQGKS